MTTDSSPPSLHWLQILILWTILLCLCNDDDDGDDDHDNDDDDDDDDDDNIMFGDHWLTISKSREQN